MQRTAPPRSDGDLMAAYAAGDERAFAELVRRHGGMVRSVCLRALGQSDDADDAAQAVFLALARKASRLKGVPDAGAWLHRAARLAARMALRTRRRRARHEHEAASLGERTAEQGMNEPDRKALIDRVDESLDALPESYRRVLVACFLEGRTQVEAAERLGIPLGTVAVYRRRGLDRLRETLARRGVVVASRALASFLVSLSAEAAGALPAGFVASAVASAGGAAPAGVAALSKGMVSAMAMTQMKVAAAVLLSLAIPLSGAVLLASPEPVQAAGAPLKRSGVPKDDATFTVAEFEKLHKELNVKNELWTAIPWQLSITEGRRVAAKEKKPLFIVAGNGHLLGRG